MVREEGVPRGYKKTEVGVIPEEWEVKRLGEIASIGRGRVISHREINSTINQTYPVYSSQTTNDGLMGFIDTYDFEGEYVTWTTDGVNAGRVFYRNGKFNCTNVCGTIRLGKDDHRFIAAILNRLTPGFVSKNLANPKLMNNVMKNMQIPLPPLPEQKAIAEVLSDVDKLIASMDAANRQKTVAEVCRVVGSREVRGCRLQEDRGRSDT